MNDDLNNFYVYDDLNDLDDRAEYGEMAYEAMYNDIKTLDVQIYMVDTESPDVDPDFYTGNMTLLQYACELGEPSRVKYILQNGGDPNQIDFEGQTVCDLAIRMDYYEIVQHFIDGGLEVNNTESMYIYTAVYCGNIKMVTMFLNAGAQFESSILNVNNGGSSLEMLKLLVSNLKTLKRDDVQAALFVACIYSSVNVVKYLISLGGDIHEKCHYDTMTCLLYACKSGNLNVVKFLIYNGVDTGHVSKYGNSTMDLNKKNKNVIDFMIRTYLFNNKNGFHDAPSEVTKYLEMSH
jgi:ankyrin repeat protein